MSLIRKSLFVAAAFSSSAIFLCITLLSWLIATNGYALVLLATLPEGSYTLRPFHRDWVPISPDVAFWLLENTEFPYMVCSNSVFVRRNQMCDEQTLLSFASAGLGSPDTHERAIEVTSILISRGLDLNNFSYHHLGSVSARVGMAPIHEAVLANDSEYARRLLEAGANVDIKIDGDGSKYHGLTALEYLDLISTNSRFDFSSVREVLVDFGA